MAPINFKIRPEYLAVDHPMRKRTLIAIRRAFRRHGADYAGAAAELGCSRATLYRLVALEPTLDPRLESAK